VLEYFFGIFVGNKTKKVKNYVFSLSLQIGCKNNSCKSSKAVGHLLESLTFLMVFFHISLVNQIRPPEQIYIIKILSNINNLYNKTSEIFAPTIPISKYWENHYYYIESSLQVSITHCAFGAGLGSCGKIFNK